MSQENEMQNQIVARLSSNLRMSGLAVIVGAVSCVATCSAQDAQLPSGVKAVWALEKAFREKTPTRERVCMNGLWRWQPTKLVELHKAVADEISSELAAGDNADKIELRNALKGLLNIASRKKPTAEDNAELAKTLTALKSNYPVPYQRVVERLIPDLPGDNWGYFKVPGCWPAVETCYFKNSQRVFSHPDWKIEDLKGVTVAWYQREFSVPGEWTGRKITLWADCINSKAVVFVDGKKAGEILFARGEVDLTASCHPGEKHVLSILVQAVPLKAVMLSFNDTNSVNEVRGSVERRGLCGDVYLVGEPAISRISDLKVDTSVRNGEIKFEAELQDLPPDKQFTLRAQLMDNGRMVKEFSNQPFKRGDLKEGRIEFGAKWKADKLWDVNAPQNTYELQFSLLDSADKVLDTHLPVRVGFREFWIDGHDFYLNGSRIHLRAAFLDNQFMGAAWASYEGARETLKRLQSFGINFVYTHNDSCVPGSHLAFDEVLRAADDLGMLVAFTQPHFGTFDWDAPDADSKNGYAAYARLHTQIAQNHPSVVCYVMNHNATGTAEDMNPEHIDGVFKDSTPWSAKNIEKALRAEAIVNRIDPSRFTYFHSSGNCSSVHTSNFYPNWTPIQELDDWFEHWATQGAKPVYTCEYGAPFGWDWTMYRGWYKGKRAFGNGIAAWEFCIAEWNSQFLGDHAFQISQNERDNLRFESKNLAAGKEWARWDYPHEPGSRDFDEEFPIFAQYLTQNWRAYRTWGVSAISPWEFPVFWTTRLNEKSKHKDLAVDWDNLQRPGFSADYTEGGRHERIDLSFDRSDWTDTPAAQALLRNNMPILAYIGGKPARFTSKDHNFFPGEPVEKQLIIINDSRETIVCDCTWSLNLSPVITGSKNASVKPGEQERILLRFDLAAGVAPGSYSLAATVKVAGGVTQEDSFAIQVLSPNKAAVNAANIGIFDPKGETTRLLEGMGIKGQAVAATSDLAPFDTLIVGKAALTIDGAAPDIARVRDGLKVVLFEQTSDVLEKRFGFRVQEYGLRNVFKRVPDHPLLAGLNTENLHDWRGEATILPSHLNCPLSGKLNMAPAIKWCDIEVSHIWRAGCRGNVASVLIEKPACGDFLPLVDGGFSLQYSPLIEHHEGKGLVLFCQMDVTGRTETDPAAETLVRNILQYVSAWKAAPSRTALYVGDVAGKTHLERTGIHVAEYAGSLDAGKVLIVGPGGQQNLSGKSAEIDAWLKAGGKLLALGIDDSAANTFLPFKLSTKKSEHIAAFFEPFGANSPFAGVGPADVHNRDPRDLYLVAGGATPFGDGVLANAGNANVVFCQMPPWQFTYSIPQNTKRTFRRASFLLTRVLGNLGVCSLTPILDRFHTPCSAEKPEKRWLDGLYLDQPDEWDNPYRFFRW